MYGIKQLLEKELLDMNILSKAYQKELKKMPNGCLSRKQVNHVSYYYWKYKIKEYGTSRYVQKYLSNRDSGQEMIALLKRKRFLELSLRSLNVQIKRSEQFLSNYTEFDPMEIESSMSPTYSEIQMKQGSTDSFLTTNAKAWLTESFVSNPFAPERLTHTTASGLHVRSKSEAIIVNLLDTGGIPYRYEAPLKLDDRTFYPDFTVLRPFDQKLIYWEHFGMVSDPGYQCKMDRKLSLYRLHQITPWNNLITTYDDENGSIDVRQIIRVIDIFLREGRSTP